MVFLVLCMVWFFGIVALRASPEQVQAELLKLSKQIQESIVQVFPEERSVKYATDVRSKTLTVSLPENILRFKANKYDLSRTARSILDAITERVPDGSSLVVAGHADASGFVERNFELSVLRAYQVSNYLRDAKKKFSSLKIEAFGDAKPIVPNTNPNNRALNRRVELRFGNITLNHWLFPQWLAGLVLRIDEWTTNDPLAKLLVWFVAALGFMVSCVQFYRLIIRRYLLTVRADDEETG